MMTSLLVTRGSRGTPPSGWGSQAVMGRKGRSKKFTLDEPWAVSMSTKPPLVCLCDANTPT